MPRQPKTVYFIVQEGGSSGELYLHTFNQARAAERHRRDCAEGAYRTSPVGTLPTKVADALQAIGDPELFDAVLTLAAAAENVE